MYFIQQWNHPEFIYQLITLTFCMLTSIYSYFWIKFRAVHVNEELNPKAQKSHLTAISIHFALVEVVIFALTTAFIIVIPKILPLFSFIIAFLFAIALCTASIFYLKWFIRKSKLIPAVVDQNMENWKGRTNAKYRFVRPSLLILSMALMLLAMMDPEGTEKTSKLRRTPMNVTILLDLSRSMDARDYKSSRLTVAKDEINKLVEQGAGDKIGLVYFTDTTIIQAPQTLDNKSIQGFLNVVSTDSMPSHGTDINLALQTALRTFNPGEDLQFIETGHATRRVVLVTDGETHTGDINATLEQFVERNIHIDVIAVGTENGAEIPDKNGIPMKYQNNTVITKVQSEYLKSIADKTDGMFIQYRVPDVAALTLLSNWDVIRVGTNPKGLASSLYRTQLYQYFLYPAYILLVLFLIHPLFVRLFRPFFEYIRRKKELRLAQSKPVKKNKLEE